MKAKFFIPLIVISFVLFSCNSGISSGSQGSISFDTTGAADSISRNVVDGLVTLQANTSSYDESKFVSYTIKVKIETEGDYVDSAENVYSKKLSELLNTTDKEKAVISFIKDSLSKPISIKGIPSGSSIKVKLSITNTVSLDKDAFKKSLSGSQMSQYLIDSIVDSISNETKSQSKSWDGESENFVVRGGENKVNIKLKGLNLNDYKYEYDDSGVNIFLYARTEIGIQNQERLVNSAIFSFPSSLLTSSKAVAPEIYFLDDGYSDFMFDSDNNIYYSVELDESEYDELGQRTGEEKTGIYFYKNKDLITKYTIYGDQETYEGFFYEERTGLLFYITQVGTYSVFAYDIKNKESLSYVSGSILPFGSLFDFAISFDEPSQTPDGLVYEGACYVATRGLEFQKTPIKYIVSEKSVDTNGQSETNSLSQGSPNFAQSLSSDATITDMIVQNGKLYLLLRDVTPSFETREKTVHFDQSGNPEPIEIEYRSRGALISIDTTDFKYPNPVYALSDSAIMTSSVINIPFEILNPHKNSEDQAEINFTIYQPVKNSSFFGPEKFISIKPDRLVIADDGYYFYKDNNDQLRIKNINNVVQVKLNSDGTPKTDMITTQLRTSVPIPFFYEMYNNITINCSVNNDTYPVECIVE